MKWEYNLASPNVNKPERILTALGGGALLSYGLARRTLSSLFYIAGGILLLHHGITGKSRLYQALKINTNNKKRRDIASVGHGEGIKIERSIVIERTPNELYRFWRNFENLPQFMQDVRFVTVTDPIHSHWVIEGPAGKTVEWDAVVHHEIPNQSIAWRSVEGSPVDHAGTVLFHPTPEGFTEIKIVLNYSPPAGKLGEAVLEAFGKEPGERLEENLRRLKEIMEPSPVAQ
jgi:uncharacterized membrane protein